MKDSFNKRWVCKSEEDPCFQEPITYKDRHVNKPLQKNVLTSKYSTEQESWATERSTSTLPESRKEGFVSVSRAR